MGEISPSAAWIIVLIICLIFEAITLGLTTIWFALGALITCIVSLFVDNFTIQLFVFFGTSILFLLLTRPIAVKYFSKNKTKTNYESLIGKTGIVLTTINNIKNEGRVQVGSETWLARSENDEIIEKEAIVTISEIKGVRLIVKQKKDK